LINVTKFTNFDSGYHYQARRARRSSQSGGDRQFPRCNVMADLDKSVENRGRMFNIVQLDGILIRT
jgi:hypothetical protein